MHVLVLKSVVSTLLQVLQILQSYSKAARTLEGHGIDHDFGLVNCL
eukprot:COSAG05_NODE_2363_length_3174_cov_2.055935_2_plen_46_part_00